MEETEKKDIQDADVSDVEKKENIKKGYRTEIILIFVIGLLVGIMFKAEAVKRVSIGFSDYKTITKTQGYDIEAIEKSLFEKAEKATEADSQQEEVIVDDNADQENN